MSAHSIAPTADAPILTRFEPPAAASLPPEASTVIWPHWQRILFRFFIVYLLLFPIFIPALLGMVEATSAILIGDAEPGLWIKLLAGYDLVFTTISLLLFATILHAE